MEGLDLLIDTLRAEGILLPDDAIVRFGQYLQLLRDWNQKINLISPGDAERIITRHFLESMDLCRELDFPEKDSVLDLGTGAGFPGLPIKIFRPDLNMILVESIGKKVLFLQQVVRVLQMDGVRILHGRMENMAAGVDPVHHIVSRAVSDLTTLMGWCMDGMAAGTGRLIVLKGEEVFKEIEDLKNSKAGRLISRLEVRPYKPFRLALRSKPSYLAVIQRA
jgi:16S rRNA (guanine527-N7)-methyltransferase